MSTKRHILATFTLGLTVLITGCATPTSSGRVYSSGQARQEQTVRMGVVESVREVTLDGSQGPVGTIAGGAIGGIAGANAIYAAKADMIGCYIGDNGDIAVLKGQACLQDSAASTFEDCEIYRRVFQYKGGAYGTRTVALHHELVLDVNAIARSISNLAAGTLRDVRGEARSGGLAIGAGYRNYRNATCASLGK